VLTAEEQMPKCKTFELTQGLQRVHQSARGFFVLTQYLLIWENGCYMRRKTLIATQQQMRIKFNIRSTLEIQFPLSFCQKEKTLLK